MALTAPAYPFTASTINATRPNRVKLKCRGYDDEHVADVANIYPGMLLQLQSDGGVVPHAVIGGGGGIIIAKEDALQGFGLLDPYPNASLVSDNIPLPGDWMLLIVNAGALAILEGQSLISAGDGTVIGVAATQGGVELFENAASSTVVANTTAETVFSISYTIPANLLRVGDVIRIRGAGSIPGVHSTDTQLVKLKLTPGTSGSAVVLYTSATINPTANDIFEFEAELVVRTIGATGTFIAEGVQGIGTPGTATEKSFNTGSQTVDTTQTQIVQVSATCSVANAGNQIQLDILEVELGRSLKAVAKALEPVDNHAGSAFTYIKAEIISS